MTTYSNIVVQNDIVADYRVRANSDIMSKFRLWAYDRCGVKGHFRESLLHLLDWSESGAADLIAALDNAAVDESR